MTAAGTDTCSKCHVPHSATTATGLFRDWGASSGELPVCYECHDGTGSLTDIKAGPDSFSGASGHVLEALVDTTTPTDLSNTCSSCHKPHGDYVSRPDLPGATVNGVAIASRGNAWCLACHDDANAWFARIGTYPALSSPSRDASGYPVAGTFAGATVYADGVRNAHVRIDATGGAKPRQAGDCLHCHAAHGSSARYDALVSTLRPSTTETVAADRSSGAYAALCFTCHAGGSWETSGAPNVKQYATYGSADTGIGASGGHRIKSGGGTLPVNAPLPCYDCHNPHGSSRGNDTLLSDALGGGLDTTDVPAEAVRRFCLTCHTTSDGLGWDGVSSYAAPAADAEVEGLLRLGGPVGSGPDGGQNWLRLRAASGHLGADTSMSCYDCHGDDYSSPSGNNVHDPATYTVASHTGNPTASTITILGTSFGPFACTQCHLVELGPEHAKATSSNNAAACSECHPNPRSSLTPWNKATCAQGGCHTAGSAAPMHGLVDPAHDGSIGGCAPSGCHTGGINAAAIHSTATTTVAGVPRTSCQICHASGVTPSLDCTGCHGAAPHANMDALHTSTNGSAWVEWHEGDSMTFTCSDCHTMALLPLHANYCGACHSSTAPANVRNAVAANDTSCSTCHPGDAHDWNISFNHDGEDYSSCGPCHGNGCYCHSAWTPVPDPHTTSDAIASYVGGASVRLTATDNVSGSFGIKQTYYTVDGGPTQTGTLITVPAPASGTQSHTIRFWSTDWSNKTETPHEASFTVSRDVTPPVTTSNALAAYGTTATITLTATDDSRDFGARYTFFNLDGSGWTTGTVVTVPRSAGGTIPHTLEFLSVDWTGNRETTKSVGFDIVHDDTPPVTTDSIPDWVGSSNYYLSFYLYPTDAAPSSGLASVNAWSVDPVTAWYKYGSPTTYTLFQVRFANEGIKTITYSSTDREGNVEPSKTATVGVDRTAPVTTSDAVSSYSGTATVNFTASDALSGVSATYWRTFINATWTNFVAGTSMTVSPPVTGSKSVTLYYYSRDVAGNTGSTQSRTFTVYPPNTNYTLTYAAGPNGTISGTSPQTVSAGSSGSAVTAVPSTGYHFVNWSDGSTANPRTDANVLANKSVTANFAINTYSLIYAAGANGTISGTSPQVVAYGGSGTPVTAVGNAGYHFVSWSDGSTANARTDTNVIASKSVTASFAPNTYTLTYAADANGTISGTSPQTVNHGGSGTAVTAVADSGYHFVSWSDGSTLNPRTDTGVTGDKALTATFAPNGLETITAIAGVGGTISPAGAVLVADGSNQTFTITPDAGYSIAQVMVDGVNQGAVASYTFTNVVGPHVITASFGASGQTSIGMTEVVWLDANDGASGAWGTYSIYVNDVLIGTKSASADPTWSCPQVLTPSGGHIDIVVDCGFTSLSYTFDERRPVTYTLNLPPGTTKVDASTWTGFPDMNVVNEWWDDYDDWYTGVWLGTGTISNIRYSASTYVLTYTAGANGTISGTSPQTVSHGASGSAVTASASAGYHFVNWSDGSSANPRTDTNVTGSKSVTANFAVDTYTLTYTAGANGTISGTSPQSVVLGGSGAAVTAVPNGGYHFVNWSDGSTANPRIDTNVTANKSVTANFAVGGSFTLTYSAGSNGGISGTSPQTVASGGNGSAVTAVANTGFHFVNWSDGSTANPRMDTNVNANKSVTANFAANTYSLNAGTYANGSISPPGLTLVGHGASQAYSATPNGGYRLAYWLVDGTYRLPTQPFTFSNVTANHTITSAFAGSATVTLIYNNTAAGYAFPSGPQIVTSGGAGPAVTAYPYYGYHFVDWSDGTTTITRTDIGVTVDQAITPNFAPNTYTVTYAAQSGGTVTGNTAQTGLYGTSGTAVTAVANAGYHFLGWSDGLLAATRTDTFPGDVTVTAYFAADGTKTLQFAGDGNGYVTGQWIQGVAPGGTSVAVTAEPYDSGNYTFSYWYDGATVRWENPLTIANVNADATWTAYFSYSGSCPFLFTWDGDDFKFEADEFAAGKLALQTSKGYRKPNPLDYHMLATIPAVKNGALEYKLVEERDETDYLDQVKLFTVDAPADRDIYIERSQAEGVGQFTTLDAVIHTTAKNLQPPPSVRWLNTGQDVRSKLAASDQDYVVLNSDRNVGFKYQTLELELGDVQSAPQTKLVIDGRTMIPSSPAGRAYSRQFGPQVKFEVQDASGNWVAVPTTNTILPKPPEFTRPFVLDLSKIWISDSRRVRLTYLYKTYIDSILLDTSADVPVTITELPLLSADLQPHGFNFRSGAGELFEYVYGSPSAAPRYKLPGNYTRFGAVAPLLGAIDDKFVIFGGGDEITMRFDPPATTPSDVTRRFLFLSNGYYKDLKENVQHTVEPLPFAAMSNFPYPATESYPTDADHQQYLSEWNTRAEGF